MANDQPKQLLLWGDSAVGKTTLLASYLFGCEDHTLWINQNATSQVCPDDKEGYKLLANNWRKTCCGVATPATGQSKVDIRIITSNKAEVHFIDVQGELTRENNSVLLNGGLKPDGILCLIDRDRQRLRGSLDSLEVARHHGLSQGIETGVVITKADQFLEEDDPAWDAALGWWEDALRDDDSELRSLLARYGERVWPVSAYGFCEDGMPAVIWSEFGQILPYRVAPHQVHRPFEHMLRGWEVLS